MVQLAGVFQRASPNFVAEQTTLTTSTAFATIRRTNFGPNSGDLRMNTTANLYKGKTVNEWAKIEADAHDSHYQGSFPFGGNGYSFTVEQAIRYEDYGYKYGRARWGHRTKKFLEFVNLNDLAGKRLLDVGSGTGQLGVLYAMQGAHVTGVELSTHGTEIANKTATVNGLSDQCDFITAQFTDCDFPAESFDVVTMHATLHHLIKYPGVKEQIARILKPGGRLVIGDTVEGGFGQQFFRNCVKFAVNLRTGQKEQEENLGDVLLKIQDYEKFAEGFSSHEIYRMDHFYMVNKVFERISTKALWARSILWMAKVADDVIGTVPFIRNRFGGAVMRIIK
jgi:ubiquinone/menaquinone biosynthesis C-methylase UbiE